MTAGPVSCSPLNDKQLTVFGGELVSQKAFIVQIPQGQVSAQKPQAIHFVSSDIYS